MSSEDRTPYAYEVTGEVTDDLRNLAQKMILAQGDDRDRLEREVDRHVRFRLRRMHEDIKDLVRLGELVEVPAESRGAGVADSQLESDLEEFTPGDEIWVEVFGGNEQSINERVETYPLAVLEGWRTECLAILNDVSLLRGDFEETEGPGFSKQFLEEERLARLLALLPLPALEDLVRGSSGWEERAAARRQRLSALLTRLEQEAGPDPASLASPDQKALQEQEVELRRLRRLLEEKEEELRAYRKSSSQ